MQYEQTFNAIDNILHNEAGCNKQYYEKYLNKTKLC